MLIGDLSTQRLSRNVLVIIAEQDFPRHGISCYYQIAAQFSHPHPTPTMMKLAVLAAAAGSAAAFAPSNLGGMLTFY
jgi:hypothetical protein